MRRTAKVFSGIVGIGAGIVAVVWVLRDRLVGTEAVPSPPPRPPAFRVVPSSSAKPVDPAQDLATIHGIGPAYRSRLAEAGIVTFGGLAAATPAAVAEATGASEARAEEWIAQARELAG